MRTATVAMTVAGVKLQFQLTVPPGPTPPIELLPIFQSMTDAFVGAAVENAKAAGETISCRKGCGACCRQLVPISEVEVESIRRLVRALPEPRRSQVIERFAIALQQLDQAGLLEALRAPASVPREDIQAFGDAYFAQQVACPFLEDESCSIHPKRPLVCREYLVMSPAAHCAKPSADTIRCVAMPVKMSRAIRHLDMSKQQPSATWIPMILALEWRKPERAEATPPTGVESVSTVFREITGRDVPDPDAAAMLD